jgi:hypothetical protein
VPALLVLSGTKGLDPFLGDLLLHFISSDP